MKLINCNLVIRFFLGGIMFFSAAYAQAIDLSPNMIGGGNIPGGHSLVNFRLADGDWTPIVKLPNDVQDSAVINIISSAQYGSSLAVSNTEVESGTLEINNGYRYSLKYSRSQGRWNFDMPTYTPNSHGDTVPDFTGVGMRMARYHIWDGNFTYEVKLPRSAPDGSLVFVRSDAAYNASIGKGGVLYGNTLLMQRGDTYIMKYRASLRAWVPFRTPTRYLGALQAGLNMAPPSAPKTEVLFMDGNWINRIILPKVAGDRDKIIIKSVASLASVIDNAGVDFQGSMKLFSGGAYEFIFIKEKGVWQMLSSPSDVVSPLSLVSGQLPNMSVSKMVYNSWDGGFHWVVKLPVSAKMGDVVIVRSYATFSFTVVKPYETAGDTVTAGDNVRYVYKGVWVRDTRIITMLSVYSSEVSEYLGDAVIRARMNEATRLTNEALENSNSNFYIKHVGFLKRASLGETQNLILERIRDDRIVQDERNRALADGVYYEGLEGPSCGLAWVSASAYNMVGASNTGCGATVMRHEFGHNMGLYHSDDVAKAAYAKGYGRVGTIMGGNGIPYYSSPRLYTSDYGIPMGVDGQIDGVRAMDERSEAVSNYRGTGRGAEQVAGSVGLSHATMTDNPDVGNAYVFSEQENADDVLESKYGISKKNHSHVKGDVSLYKLASSKIVKDISATAVPRSIIEKRIPIEYDHSALLDKTIGDAVSLYVPELDQTFQVSINFIEIAQGVVRWSGKSLSADPASNQLVISQLLNGEYAIGTLLTDRGAFNIEAKNGEGWIVNQSDDFVDEDDKGLLRDES